MSPLLGPRKPHVGFPEMAKHEYAKQILAAGFKVVVVEQVERVVETNQRKNEEKNLRWRGERLWLPSGKRGKTISKTIGKMVV